MLQGQDYQLHVLVEEEGTGLEVLWKSGKLEAGSYEGAGDWNWEMSESRRLENGD